VLDLVNIRDDLVNGEFFCCLPNELMLLGKIFRSEDFVRLAFFKQKAAAGNSDAAVLAGRALVAAARRVDQAMQNARASMQLQNGWSAVRRQINTIDTAPQST